ncbi:MAG: symmetrical bis(5'-nucleosyl)-tetraphosphatase [Pseudomonadales bacterium]|nr:symmetrical bis(5'-nucleosyl)-tetraphosphatase [Pseudomonadales bacterium]MBO6564105.1 symmetrical bis(5'-nucleosyl)-tetraphosphatase [Pseudomonadales bacterium]MBO6597641.1 symmetrical bis(5'-nucleosyl)-tetraphosphatase [Pseudomonadales bacterium]MBO6658303.1 symmetrical bis(5'-nucleosyl)-tetraphosphatase [Pseudomonadales bacterium]MBO6823879.1 symmetrical bis(5'-nucleosyl)-tetraphosphatase [Pseudomonadales bacterium]
MSTYVFGDVQGCATELQQLLEHIDYQQSEDHLWFVGDMINRGPDNAGVLDLLMQLPNVTCVLGNHDLHFMAIALGCQTQKRGDTVSDLLEHKRLQDYVDYLRQLPLIHYDKARDDLMVHAGLPPNLSTDTCLSLAAEVEQVIQSDQLESFLTAMYGNEPSAWDNNLMGMDRLRLITNYFTRLRFCTADGDIELLHKTDVAPEGYSPWFSFSRREETRILFGHWAALEGKVDAAFAVALDTGCVWGRHLTALRLEDNQLFSVPAAKTEFWEKR